MIDGHIPDRTEDTLVDPRVHIQQRKIGCLLPPRPHPTYAPMLKHSISLLETTCIPRKREILN